MKSCQLQCCCSHSSFYPAYYNKTPGLLTTTKWYALFSVALNYQSEGRVLQLNRAKFYSNGNCGYILKPACMCEGQPKKIRQMRLSKLSILSRSHVFKTIYPHLIVLRATNLKQKKNKQGCTDMLLQFFIKKKRFFCQDIDRGIGYFFKY